MISSILNVQIVGALAVSDATFLGPATTRVFLNKNKRFLLSQSQLINLPKTDTGEAINVELCVYVSGTLHGNIERFNVLVGSIYPIIVY